MCAATALVPKYRHHKGSGQAFVQVKGRRHYLGKWGSPQSRERYARFVAELATSPPPILHCASVEPALTVVELCARYLNHAEAYYVKDGRPTDHLHTVRIMLRTVWQLYGNTQAVEFGPLALRAVRERFVAAGHARGTVNARCGALKRMFKWAVASQLLPVTVYQSLTTVPDLKRGRTSARESQAVLPVDDNLFEATLPYLPVVVADMVKFQRFTGCRPGEVFQLRPMDVDRSGAVWQYRPASHKTEHHGRQRVIAVGPKAQATLRPYLLRPATAYCFSPTESAEKQRAARHAARRVPISCGNKRGLHHKKKPIRQPGTRYTKDSYHQAIERAVAKANRVIMAAAIATGTEPKLLARWHPNQLRHSAATEIRRQFGLEAAQVVLGHARADVTEIYAERDQSLASAIMRQVG